MNEATPHTQATPHGRKARDKRYRDRHRVQRAAYHLGYMRIWRARQKGQATARTLAIRDFPKGDCKFTATWPDGFKVEVQVTQNTATLIADAWEEEIALTSDGKRFVCNICGGSAEIIHDSKDGFACVSCVA